MMEMTKWINMTRHLQNKDFAKLAYQVKLGQDFLTKNE